MKKTIAFFVRTIDGNSYPFNVRDLYYYSYQEYLLAMKAAGADAYFVTDNTSYEGKGVFTKAWSIDKVSEVADFLPVGKITADVVFEKGGFIDDGIPTVTDKILREIMNDKAATYARFAAFQPLSIVCHSRQEVQAAMDQVPGDMVVVKNPVGSGGKRVYIGTRSGIEIPKDEIYPLIVQEFVDMSGGIPGLAAGIHDLRVLMAGSKIIGATLRQPREGSLFANVSKGATEKLLGYDEIPAEVRDIALQIDAQLQDLPRYYAADFARGKNGWKLIELNNRPGLFRKDNGPLAAGFMQSLAEYLVSL